MPQAADTAHTGDTAQARDGADRIECAQRHDARDPVGGDRCQAIGATLIAFVITVP